MNADPHVHVGVGHLTDSPVEKRRNGVSGIGLVPKRANNQPDYLGTNRDLFIREGSVTAFLAKLYVSGTMCL